MNFQTLQELQSYLEEGDPVFRMLEGKIRELRTGEALLEIPYKTEITRRGGVLNGGMIMTIMDFAGGIAVASVNDGDDQVTQELKVNFLEPMYKGPFLCRAKVLRKGYTAIVVDIELRDQDGRIGAKGLGTWYIIRGRKVKKEE
ncbi:PaaI family thioesterase [Metallosphaera tengchongensis]|uniref:PaaI family thioesterase n=1 Tax=Metallosphaera tengchongensis TaxID=1532350 RepID=A0A6N0NV53_9CREN|nr:PaaI family thioesterase [Metallosphaera tengchongensis]QKR00065.1 PaaI family thioesterase [Metallosphaera tengchongensis]